MLKPTRLLVLSGLLLATLGAAVDLYPLYAAHTAFEAEARTAGAFMASPAVGADLDRLNRCHRQDAAALNRAERDCLVATLPHLTTALGNYVGAVRVSLWLTHAPEDPVARTAGLQAAARSWRLYQQTDRQYYRAVDRYTEAQHRSRWYRFAFNTSPSELDQRWRRLYKELEMALYEPALAQKQRARDLQEVLDANRREMAHGVR